MQATDVDECQIVANVYSGARLFYAGAVMLSLYDRLFTQCNTICSSTKVLKGVKIWVFNPALNCPQLMDDECICDGSAFQTTGAANYILI